METATLSTTCTVRELPVEEWDRLRALPFAEKGLPDPRLTKILVAETPEGRIVGVWAAMTQVFLDGLWVAPDYRRTSWVAMKLLRGMRDLLRRLGIVQSFTLVQTTDVLCLATKAGFVRVQGDLCVLELSQKEVE
jgi:hypothetical protein